MGVIVFDGHGEVLHIVPVCMLDFAKHFVDVVVKRRSYSSPVVGERIGLHSVLDKNRVGIAAIVQIGERAYPMV